MEYFFLLWYPCGKGHKTKTKWRATAQIRTTIEENRRKNGPKVPENATDGVKAEVETGEEGLDPVVVVVVVVLDHIEEEVEVLIEGPVMMATTGPKNQGT